MPEIIQKTVYARKICGTTYNTEGQELFCEERPATTHTIPVGTIVGIHGQYGIIISAHDILGHQADVMYWIRIDGKITKSTRFPFAIRRTVDKSVKDLRILNKLKVNDSIFDSKIRLNTTTGKWEVTICQK
jgi:hypothetical protein